MVKVQYLDMYGNGSTTLSKDYDKLSDAFIPKVDQVIYVATTRENDDLREVKVLKIEVEVLTDQEIFNVFYESHYAEPEILD